MPDDRRNVGRIEVLVGRVIPLEMPWVTNSTRTNYPTIMGCRGGVGIVLHATTASGKVAEGSNVQVGVHRAAVTAIAGSAVTVGTLPLATIKDKPHSSIGMKVSDIEVDVAGIGTVCPDTVGSNIQPSRCCIDGRHNAPLVFKPDLFCIYGDFCLRESEGRTDDQFFGVNVQLIDVLPAAQSPNLVLYIVVENNVFAGDAVTMCSALAAVQIHIAIP